MPLDRQTFKAYVEAPGFMHPIALEDLPGIKATVETQFPGEIFEVSSGKDYVQVTLNPLGTSFRFDERVHVRRS